MSDEIHRTDHNPLGIVKSNLFGSQYDSSALKDQYLSSRSAEERRIGVEVQNSIVELSLIIPAFNESSRLPPFLQSVLDHMSSLSLEGFEVIVVDDGSTDSTANYVSTLAETWPQLSLIRHDRNQGKGAAVRTGVLAARGRFILFADADGATPIEDEMKLRKAIETGADIAVGSRLIADNLHAIRRNRLRSIGGRLYAFLLHRFLRVSVQDTQCGFKMFRKDVGERLFRLCDTDGFLFDAHLIAIAEALQFRIVEVPVRWTEIPGSKFRLFRDTWRMIAGLFASRTIVKRAVEIDRLDSHSSESYHRRSVDDRKS
jgi:dolichyl-phosphate beta-glucosyltransferase